VGAHGVDHAERVGGVAEVRQVAGQERRIGGGKLGGEARDCTQGHVDVAEAHEPHR
jgi:hypothetical protein